MSYNILAINPGHNGSLCLLVDGEIELYIEEERLTREKYSGNPLRALTYVLERYHVDTLCLGGTGEEMYPKMTWNGEDPFSGIVRRFNPNVTIVGFWENHHIGHAAGAFYNSGFDSAVCVVVDGAGSFVDLKIEGLKYPVAGFETESVYHFSYPSNVELIRKTIGGNLGIKSYTDDKKIRFDGNVNITKAYESVTSYAGFHPIEAGKLMGLSSYGGPNENIPDLFYGEDANKNLFTPVYPSGGLVNINNFPYLRLKCMENEINPIGADITEIAKNPDDLKIVQDFAWKVQQDTQRLVGDLIERVVEITGEKNVVISGGYGLNCVANYYYKKRFPNLNLYVDAISHDGGTSVGLAKLAWYEHCQRNEIEYKKHPLKTLYLGIDRNDDVNLDGLESEFNIKEVTSKDVATLISEQNIVSLFNGSAEAGPRALGNRSILFDPRNKNGKDIVNKVKGREWFRPFAGSILKEYANDWFDMAGLEESPFMMYAVDVLPNKLEEIPCITHVDNTCRIQTVTREQNYYYYDLISEFHKLTGVPILFNTSFNLAGDPLVETFENALDTLRKSQLKYLYVPSKGILLEKKNG